MAKGMKKQKKEQETERQEKKESLTRKIIELFQKGKEKGFTATPRIISRNLKSDYHLTELIMRRLEEEKINILYSFKNEHQMYSSKHIHLWKKTTEEAEKLMNKYLKSVCKLLDIKYD